MKNSCKRGYIIFDRIDMYDEARYVASLSSDEPELKEFNAQYNESIRHGFGRKEIEGLYNI